MKHNLHEVEDTWIGSIWSGHYRKNMLTFQFPKVGILIFSEPIHTSEPGISTKILYFTEKSVTPFLTSIPKR